MMKTKSTKRALLSSVLALVLCVSMLVGTTFAWFTDSVTSVNNKIVAGNLDIELYWSADAANWNKVNSDTNVFSGKLWEPGHTEVIYLKAVNEGTLALKYQLGVNIVSEKTGTNVDEETFKLSDYIMFGVEETADKFADRAAAVKAVENIAAPISKAYSKDSSLLKGEEAYVALVVYMPETVGNEANYRGDAPEIDLGINLIATQFTYESDSFDNQYDNVTAVSTADELKAAVQAGGNVLLANDIAVTDWTATIAKDVETNLYLNGKTLAATSTKSTGNYMVFSVKNGGTLNIIGDGTVSVAHVGNNMGWSAMTTVAHAYGDVNVSNGANIVNYGGSDMAFGLTGYIGCNMTVEDSTVASTYCAMRVQNGQTNPTETTVDVSNSALISYTHNRAFWHHYDSKTSGPVNMIGFATEADATAAGNTIYGAVRDGSTNIWVGGTEGAYPTMVTTAEALQAAIDADKTNIVLVKDIVGDVTVTQKPDVKITIDGCGNEFDGVITVDGKSATYTTAGLTIKNVKFVADSISADACIQLGDGTNATRYTCNVTVDGCTFDVPEVVGVKSYTGGDKNVTISNCVATAKAHSLAQLKGVDGVLVEKCTVNAVRGINFNNSLNITVKDSTFDVEKYAVRFGESANDVVEEFVISNCTLSSANVDGDAAIVLRKGATNANLTLENVTINAGIEMAGTDSANVVIK